MANKKRFSTRTVLIILIIILIIGAAYIVITNLPPAINYLSPGEVLNNPASYVDKEIIVKGYYAKNDAENPIITNRMDSTTGRDELLLDYSNIINATDFLREGTIYYFTGSLVLIPEQPLPSYEFVALKFEEV